MLISHKHKLAFYRVPRNASSSLEESLRGCLDFEFNRLKSLYGGSYVRHMTAEEYYSFVLPFLSQDYYKCAIVSHPARVLFSLWKSLKIQNEINLNFSSWIRIALPNKEYAKLPVAQKAFLTVNNKLFVDRLFDFNKLYLVENFLTKIFKTPIFIPHIHKHDIPNAKISPEDYQLIEEFLKNDVDLYKSVVDASGELIINPYQPTP